MERKKKKTVKIICFLCVSLAIAYGVLSLKKGNKNTAMLVNTYTLSKRDLSKTISATGVVSSLDEAKISAQTDGKVKTLNVKVGDTVNKGDILCTLDTELLELDIAEARNSLERQTLIGENNLELSEEKYNDAKNEFHKNSSSSLYSSSSGLNTAKELYRKADEDYDDARAAYRKAQNEYNKIKTAYDNTLKGLELEQLVKDQQAALNKAKTELQDLKDSGADSQQIANKQAEVSNKQNALDKTTSDLAAIKATGVTIDEDSAENLKKQMDELALKVSQTHAEYNSADDRRDTNKDSYDDSRKNYNQLKSTEEKQLNYQSKELENQRLQLDLSSQKLALQKLEMQLEKSTVKAPISGTITAVYTKEGENAGGVLFVIENLDSLKIDTNIKEYDINDVEVGMPAIVKSDAILEKEFSAELLSFAPTAKKDANGQAKASSSGVAMFESEVILNGDTEGLRIGMNTRINIILADRKDVPAVPIDAVVEKPDGTNVIYVAQQNETGYTAKEIEVDLGLSNDFYIEITSEGLENDAIVITQPNGIVDGMPISIAV